MSNKDRSVNVGKVRAFSKPLSVCLLLAVTAMVLAACGGGQRSLSEGPQDGDACVSETLADDEDGIGQISAVWDLSGDAPVRKISCVAGLGRSVDVGSGPARGEACLTEVGASEGEGESVEGGEGVAFVAWSVSDSSADGKGLSAMCLSSEPLPEPSDRGRTPMWLWIAIILWFVIGVILVLAGIAG